MTTFQTEAGNVFYIIYCSLKVRAFTQMMKLKTAQLNRSRHTCTSYICFVSVTCVSFSTSDRKRAAGKGAREKQRECLRALCI